MGFAIINKNSILNNAPAAGAFFVFFFFLLVTLALIVAEMWEYDPWNTQTSQ